MTIRSLIQSLGCAALVAILASGAAPAGAQDIPTEALNRNGVQLVMRHALAPGTGDPQTFQIDDCSTQRNLSDEGREQARAIGSAIREAGVQIDVVLTSQWCRCRETAELLGLGPVEDAPFLNSFFRDRSRSEAQTEAARERIRELAEAGQTAVFVTHQVNITALTGVYPSSGEIVPVTVDDLD